MDDNSNVSRQGMDGRDDDKERRSRDAIENSWDRMLAKGDDEFYESFNSHAKKSTDLTEGTPKKRKKRMRM